MVPVFPMAHDVSSEGVSCRSVAVWKRGFIFLALYLHVCAGYGQTFQGENQVLLHQSAGEGWHDLNTPLQTRFIGRALQEVKFMENGSQLILAAARTARKDPLDGFSVYRGGWNIRSEHYWASVSVTATPVWIVILVWVALALLILLTACLSACCFKRRFGDGVKPLDTCSSFVWLTLLAFFTVICIGGCLIFYVTSVASNRSLKNTLQVVDDEATSASVTLESVGYQLNQLMGNKFVQENVKQVEGASLEDVQKAASQAYVAANDIENKQRDNKHVINTVLDTIRITSIVISAVTLVVSIIGFLFLLLGFRTLVFTLVVLGWVLLTGVWILTGVGIVVSNVVQDTCQAMDDWLANPAASTAMDNILPCADLAATNTALSRSKQAVKDIVVYANGRINTINPIAKAQGQPLLPLVCDPYGDAPSFPVVDCAPGTVNMSTAYQALSPYVPNVVDSTTYQQLGYAVDSVQRLIDLSSSLSGLTTCSNVRSAATRIRKDHCPSLHRDLRRQWIGLLILSGAASIILLIWLYYALKKRAASLNNYRDAEKGTLPARVRTPTHLPHQGAPQQAMPGAYVRAGPSNVPHGEPPLSPFRAKRVQPTAPPYK